MEVEPMEYANLALAVAALVVAVIPSIAALFVWMASKATIRHLILIVAGIEMIIVVAVAVVILLLLYRGNL
jgi:hypothetical protein